MRLQLEFLWKIAVEGEMLHIYKPQCACFCPAWLTARKTDLVNPGGIREEGFPAGCSHGLMSQVVAE